MIALTQCLSVSMSHHIFPFVNEFDFYRFNGCLVKFTFELCSMFLYPIVFNCFPFTLYLYLHRYFDYIPNASFRGQIEWKFRIVLFCFCILFLNAFEFIPKFQKKGTFFFFAVTWISLIFSQQSRLNRPKQSIEKKIEWKYIEFHFLFSSFCQILMWFNCLCKELY